MGAGARLRLSRLATGTLDEAQAFDWPGRVLFGQPLVLLELDTTCATCGVVAFCAVAAVAMNAEKRKATSTSRIASARPPPAGDAARQVGLRCSCILAIKPISASASMGACFGLRAQPVATSHPGDIDIPATCDLVATADGGGDGPGERFRPGIAQQSPRFGREARPVCAACAARGSGAAS